MVGKVSFKPELAQVCKPNVINHSLNLATRLNLSRSARVVDLERENLTAAKCRNEALLMCGEASIRVAWIDTIFADRIYVGQIVTPRFVSTDKSANGPIPVSGLRALDFPDADSNLFRLVPHAWVKDRELVSRAAALLDELPQPHRMLFNSIFWDAGRFERFCRRPSSMIGHHSETGGNLRHTVEVAEGIRALCGTRSYANPALAVLAALLHDCGKADEYVQNAKGGWDMSDRGKLLGHKVTAVEWIVQAVTRYSIKLPPGHYESLLHVMTAVPHAPAWMGLREPVTPESMLLSLCDRLSGHDDLMEKTVNRNGGFGRFHKHLNYAPYTVGGDQ